MALVESGKRLQSNLSNAIESMSVERRKLMEIYGAEFDLTPREKGMKGAIERASKTVVANTPNAWSPSEFSNQANVEITQKTTAQEILADFPDGLDYVITGVGLVTLQVWLF